MVFYGHLINLIKSKMLALLNGRMDFKKSILYPSVLLIQIIQKGSLVIDYGYPLKWFIFSCPIPG